MDWLTPVYKPWMHEPGDAAVSQAFAQGFQGKQNALDRELRQEQLRMNWRALDIENQLKMDELATRERKALGYSALSSVLSNTSDFTDPSQEKQFWAVGVQHPYLREEMYKIHENTFGAAKALKARMSIAAEPPAAVQEVQWITRYEEMATALKDVNPTKSAYYRQQAELLKAKLLSDKEAMTFGYDDQGRPVMMSTKGGAAPLTLSTQSQIQQRGLAIEKSVNQAAELLSVLRPENLGVSGVVREGIGKTLGQIFPEMVDKQNIDARTLLRLFNERMLPSLKADAQINKTEEERLQKIMPSLTAAESYENAKPILNRLMRELREMTRTDARKAGTEIPKWALYPDEIKDLVQEKKLPVDEARELIKRYHPAFNPQ